VIEAEKEETFMRREKSVEMSGQSLFSVEYTLLYSLNLNLNTTG
jgi:hypothetical protein